MLVIGGVAAVPALGPVVVGGASVLAHDLTHDTGGLEFYPAFDDGFRSGRRVIAPEALTITRLSSARRRDGRPNGKAFYATGASSIRYWFGHVSSTPTGIHYAKGATMQTISANHEAPHLHVGIDARALIGHELAHHSDYTHGAPTVGAQLAYALEPRQPWPVPLPAWFWPWAKWRLQGGKGRRPASVPRRVPAWACRRLAALVARRTFR